MDQAQLSRMAVHILVNLPHLRSLLIARQGRLVFEGYYHGSSRDEMQNVQSMTKSVTSALVGIALRDKMIRSLDENVAAYFPEHAASITDPRMRNITIRHLLTMSSGIPEAGLSFDKVFDNPVEHILGMRLLYDPGSGFQYSSAAAHLLGGVLRKATGKPVGQFASEELFRPMGVEKFDWYADKTGLQSGGLSGLWRAGDFLKLGELYLRDGKWQGRRIVPSGFVAESGRVQNRGDFYGRAAQYGYMWWITKVAGYGAFHAAGYGGQYLMVIPKLDLVILCTSDWMQPEYPEHMALIERFVIPSVAAGRSASVRQEP